MLAKALPELALEVRAFCCVQALVKAMVPKDEVGSRWLFSITQKLTPTFSECLLNTLFKTSLKLYVPLTLYSFPMLRLGPKPV